MTAYEAQATELQGARERLVRQLSELGATEEGDLRRDVEFEEGFADAAAATAERTETIGLIESLKRMLDEVDAALARMDEGSYGTCANCGKQIPQARIEARPEAIYCVDCAGAS